MGQAQRHSHAIPLPMLSQPVDHELEIIDESELRRIEVSFVGNYRQLPAKLPVSVPDHRTAWNGSFARCGLKPIANMSDCQSRVSTVRLDVLAANIRDKALVPIWSAIHDEAALTRRAVSESFRTEKNPELQRHIESGQLIRLVGHFGSGNIVDAVITLRDQTIDILNSHFAGISQFQSASRDKTAGGNTEYDRFEDRLILRIKRTVDEDASAGGRRHFRLAVPDHQLDLRSCPRPDHLIIFGAIRPS
ncbi:MAG: hypothetical protein QOJ45_1521 [Verrucomicrobiota bacterium]